MENLGNAKRSLASSFGKKKLKSFDFEEAERQLKMEIDELWLKLNKVHTKVIQEKKVERVKNSEFTMLQVSEAKEKRLEAEISMVKLTSPSLLSTNPEVVKAVLLSDLKTSIGQLKKTLSVVKNQRRDLQERVQRENDLLKEHEAVRAALEEKIKDNLENEPVNRLLETKKNRATIEQQRLMKELAQFCMKHFPAPITESRRRRLSGKSSDDKNDYLTLLNIVEILMNNSTDADIHDPYVQITPEFWPPYVELLLRCGIAKRHPEDCNRISMTGYHL